jgi:hypothetical protein
MADRLVSSRALWIAKGSVQQESKRTSQQQQEYCNSNKHTAEFAAGLHGTQ